MMGGLEIILAAICLNSTFCNNTETALSTEIESTTIAPKEKKLNDHNALVEFYHGKHLRIGTVENYPLSYTFTDSNGTIHGRGVSFDFIEILQKKYQFTYEVVVSKDSMEGSKTDIEDTLLGMLKRKEIDVAAAFLPALSDTRKIVTYSTNIDEGEWVILMKRPSESASGSGLLAPFDAYVWYLILIAVTTFGPFVYMIIWVRFILTKDDKNKPYKIGPCVWFVYGALIKQGTSLSPDANTTRILFATWWIFITLLSAFYTANLTAFLTLSKFTLAINDPKDLAKKNNKWVAKKGSAVEYVVTNPDEDLYFLNKMIIKGRGIFQQSPRDSEYLPFVNNDYVYVRDKPAVELLMYEDYKNKTKQNIKEVDRCTYVVTKDKFMTKARAFAFPVNSTLIHLFDPVLLSIVEAGIVKFKTRYDLPGNEICPLNLKSKERRLRNGDLSMTYALAGIGIATAALVFILEIFYRYWKIKCISPFVTPDEYDNAPGAKGLGKMSPGPPPYQTLFGQPYGNIDSTKSKIKTINGRDYWIVQLTGGDTRLIPVRTPSAFLFQYAS